MATVEECIPATESGGVEPTGQMRNVTLMDEEK